MSKIQPLSLVKELDLSDPVSIINILEDIRARGISDIGFLLETCIVDVLLGGREYTLTLSEPSVVIFPSETTRQLIGFYQVTKPAWCSYVVLDTKDLLLTLANYINTVNYVIRDVEIVFHKELIECTHLYLLDTIMLKYSWRPILDRVNYEKIREILSEETKSNKHILLVCLDNQTTPIVWVEKVNNVKTLNIVRVRGNLEPVVLRAYLDYIVSILSPQAP